LGATSVNDAMSKFEINTPHRVAAFLAQIATESTELNRLVENLHYSTAKRLMAVWPKCFPSLEEAQPYVRNPEKLANYVYCGRFQPALGNGNEVSGDGWKFRGRGLMQVTGRYNYREAGRVLELALESEPELLEQPAVAALSAACYWKSHGLNELAGDGSEEQFIEITRRINRGLAALAERKKYWRKAKEAFDIA
jgi:putative chitinase